MIFHVLEKTSWESGQDQPIIATPGNDGFVHCCEQHQLAHVTRTYFAVGATLVALGLDPTHLKFETRYEVGAGTHLERFPHVYGPIETAAISEVIEL